MPLEVNWHRVHAVIFARLSGDLDISEFPELDKKILEHIEQSDRSLVHILVDLTEATQFPANVPGVHKALTHKNHPQLGWTVLITSNRLVKFVGYMITQIAKARFRSFGTMSEAMNFLQQIDEALLEEVS